MLVTAVKPVLEWVDYHDENNNIQSLIVNILSTLKLKFHSPLKACCLYFARDHNQTHLIALTNIQNAQDHYNQVSIESLTAQVHKTHYKLKESQR